MSPRPSAPARRLPPHSSGSRGAWRNSQLPKSSESMPSAAFLRVIHPYRSRAVGRRAELPAPENLRHVSRSRTAPQRENALWNTGHTMAEPTYSCECPVNPQNPAPDTANRRWRAPGTVWQSGGSPVEPGLGMRSNRPFRKRAKSKRPAKYVIDVRRGTTLGVSLDPAAFERRGRGVQPTDRQSMGLGVPPSACALVHGTPADGRAGPAGAA